MSKILTVATPVQKVIFDTVIHPEFSNGFWKAMRPMGHGAAWAEVTTVVATAGAKLGAAGFTVPRNYNLLNPGFFSKAEAALLAAARTVKPEITANQLKRELTSLSQIIGARLKEVDGVAVKLQRGRRPFASTAKLAINTGATRRAVANIVEPTPESAA